ncbi:putative transferase CAF17 homolog, mitochondrial [Oppia nitens]|uniref:putative transferase CAF17 homolog, mitochondrial n=1 Tax=Oppia nitens TaxID=1686743 RepID=UPI0023D9A561|nr:putative transferase CAF17 homolog, mitochondrial [Oppia nitens]
MWCPLTSCLLRRQLSLKSKVIINAINRRKTHFCAVKLTNKRLIRVSGAESFIYLQSFLTNDLRHLLNGEEVSQRSCVYTFLLSALGKVLADIFVYKAKLLSDGELILEVDASLAPALRRLLIAYNTTRNIRVEAVDDIDLWALIPKTYDERFNENNDFILKEVISDDFQLVTDPRLPQLGYRLLSRIGGKEFQDILPFIEDKRIEEGNIGHYRSYKYKLGVSEGNEDMLSGFYFPFELNGDYLNAISVDKGLYTSEEKTIKVYMKKPIVKRIMPVQFVCQQSELYEHSPPPSTNISSKYIRNFGTLRNRKGFNGIACLRVLSNETQVPIEDLIHIQSGLKMKTWIPEWWPQRINQIAFPETNYPENLFNIIPT